jgi:cytoskeletal protein CcmA (bactofilin family)
MFKTDESKKNIKHDIETIIGQTVKLDGDFTGEGDVIVEGIVNGNLKTDKFLRVGENAQINAEIEANDAFIAGIVNGNIKIKNKLEITSTAKIKGDIETSLISVESGASINGKCQVTTEKINEKNSKTTKIEPEIIEKSIID